MERLSVQQSDGDITITPGDTRGPRVYPVTAGAVEVKDGDVTEFLRYVDGSVVTDANYAPPAAGQAPKADITPTTPAGAEQEE